MNKLLAFAIVALMAFSTAGCMISGQAFPGSSQLVTPWREAYLPAHSTEMEESTRVHFPQPSKTKCEYVVDPTGRRFDTWQEAQSWMQSRTGLYHYQMMIECPGQARGLAIGPQ